MKTDRFHLLWLLLLTLAVGAVHAQEPAPVRVLFIGNSMTYTNNMPDWVMELSKNLEAVPPVAVQNSTRPNARFRDQLKSDARTSPLGAIRKGGWDIVVLQSEFDEPVATPDEFYAAGAQLVEEVRSTGAEPFFFQTYSPVEGYIIYDTKAWSGGSPGEMHARVSKAYGLLANRTKARVVPVGDVWHWVLGQHPEIGLYADFIHASACGSYLMACVLVAAITGKDPRAATWLPPAGVTEAEARVLREAAGRMNPGM
jgi:hypothetical protein